VTSVDAAALLWTDADFDASLLAARERLLRVRTAIESDPKLSARAPAFLASSERVLATPLNDWTDPRVAWWTSLACRLIDAAPCDTTALLRHVADFGAVDLDGMGPVARCDDYAVVVNPSPFALPGWEMAEPAIAAGVAYHERHVPLVEQTLEAMQRFAPSDYAAFQRVIRMIALKPARAGGFDDFSEPLLPGSFIASVISNPLEMADHFIHELQHNRLSFVEERGPLFASTTASGGFYSPWRDSARSLLGVFHGVYVFLAVHRYWQAVLRESEHDVAAYARDRVVRLPVQLTVAVRMLQEHASLTPLGRALLDELAACVDTIGAGADEALLHRDVPAFVATDDGGYVRQTSVRDGRPLTVAGALREHVSSHPAGNQCAPLVTDLWPFADLPASR
jgi:hypothetical protein